MGFKIRNPSKAYVFGGLYYSAPGARQGRADFAAQARRLLALGADGIKMIEGKPNARKMTGLALDSAVYASFYSFCEKNKVPVLFHVGDPEEFWDAKKAPDWAIKSGWFWGGGGYLSKERLYAETEGVLRKFPGLQVTFAHFFFLSADIARAARFLEKWPEAYFDITPGWEMYDNFTKRSDEWRDFFTRFAGRIVFGTDNNTSGWGAAPSGVEVIEKIRRFLETRERMFNGQGLGLPREALERIYRRNFVRGAGAKPKPVNREALKAECEALLKRARRMRDAAKPTIELQAVLDMV